MGPNYKKGTRVVLTSTNYYGEAAVVGDEGEIVESRTVPGHVTLWMIKLDKRPDKSPLAFFDDEFRPVYAPNYFVGGTSGQYY